VIGPAATLEHARTLVEEGKYDAALVDVNLKGQPVDELAALLTEKNCPFAFVTGYGRDALPEAFRGVAVLAKPFSSAQLLATAEGLLHPSSSVVQLRQKRR
jgi:CheY-like chemotaxis protein